MAEKAKAAVTEVVEQVDCVAIAQRRMLRVRIFPAETNAVGHAQCEGQRDSVTATAMRKYESWMGRNVLRNLEIVDIIVDNSTACVPAVGGWAPLQLCVITVKYYGDDIP